MVSIGFGGGEVVQVDMELAEVSRLLQDALAERKLVEFEAVNGETVETVVINPEQVKLLQSLDEPSPPPAQREKLAASA